MVAQNLDFSEKFILLGVGDVGGKLSSSFGNQPIPCNVAESWLIADTWPQTGKTHCKTEGRADRCSQIQYHHSNGKGLGEMMLISCKCDP